MRFTGGGGGGTIASFLRWPGAADGQAAEEVRKTTAVPGGEEPAGADACGAGDEGLPLYLPPRVHEPGGGAGAGAEPKRRRSSPDFFSAIF